MTTKNLYLESITLKELIQFGLSIPERAFNQVRGDYDVTCCWGAHCANEYFNEEFYQEGIRALTKLLKCSVSTLNALHIKAGLRVKPFGCNDWNVNPHKLFQNMEKLDIRNIKFAGEDLRHAEFELIHLMEQDFSNADLRGVDFRGAKLEGTNFKHSDLRGADFRGADLERCELDWANLFGAIYDYDTVIDRDRKVDMFLSTHDSIQD